jgi:hypothetical protein
MSPVTYRANQKALILHIFTKSFQNQIKHQQPQLIPLNQIPLQMQTVLQTRFNFYRPSSPAPEMELQVMIQQECHNLIFLLHLVFSAQATSRTRKPKMQIGSVPKLPG